MCGLSTVQHVGVHGVIDTKHDWLSARGLRHILLFDWFANIRTKSEECAIPLLPNVVSLNLIVKVFFISVGRAIILCHQLKEPQGLLLQPMMVGLNNS